jgi:hypothetical protein
MGARRKWHVFCLAVLVMLKGCIIASPAMLDSASACGTQQHVRCMRCLRSVRAACGGGSGRLRAPPAGNPTTQAAAKTLADVKTWLSAQQMGARSGSSASVSPGVPGRDGSPAPMQQARAAPCSPISTQGPLCMRMAHAHGCRLHGCS